MPPAPARPARLAVFAGAQAPKRFLEEQLALGGAAHHPAEIAAGGTGKVAVALGGDNCEGQSCPFAAEQAAGFALE